MVEEAGERGREGVPSDVLRALADDAGGKIVLILGAGCSKEPPTDLPLAGECSQRAHDQLVADGVLSIGDCDRPIDLSCLADTVVSQTGGQKALVERLPLPKFRFARPNHGHEIAAALLREGAVNCVLTLNFDLAMTNALVALDGEDVGVVEGPHQHDQIAAATVLYLHRNVNCDNYEEWILTTDALGRAWQGEWEEAVSARLLTSPITILAGLGSAAQVLTESVGKLRDALGGQTLIFQVGPGEPEDSEFFHCLGIAREKYLSFGWVDFMERMADRIVEEWKQALSGAVDAFLGSLSKPPGSPGADEALHCFCVLGLVRIGKFRARVALEDSKQYLTRSDFKDEWVAALLAGVGLVAATAEATPSFAENGTVSLHREGRPSASLALGHGQGSIPWARVEDRLRRMRRYLRIGTPVHGPDVALVCGCIGDHVIPSPPEDIVGGSSAGDLVRGDNTLSLFDVTHTMDNVESIVEVLGLKVGDVQ